MTEPGTIRLLQGDDSTDPAVGELSIYAKTNGQLYSRDSNSNEILISSGTTTYRKNVIINSMMRVWQRGSIFAPAVHGKHTADRYEYDVEGTMVNSILNSTDVPQGFSRSIKIDCTTAQSSLGVNDRCRISYGIEGYDLLPFVGKTATLSFWIKASKTGTICIQFVNGGYDRSYISEITINSANTWEKKTVTVDFNFSGGTWNYENDLGLKISWVIAAGSGFQNTSGSWLSGDWWATSNQTNFCESTSDEILLTGVQFEVSPIATEFEYIPIADDIVRCQRYYCKSYSMADPPGTVTSIGRNGYHLLNSNSSDYTLEFSTQFPTRMRAIPTVTLYDLAGHPGKVSMQNGNNITGTTTFISDVCFTAGGTNGFATTDRTLYFHYTAEAEL